MRRLVKNLFRSRPAALALIAGVLMPMLWFEGCSVQHPDANLAEFRVITDDLGRAVRVPMKIERAVSLAPNLTENVFAIGAGDRLVGVTTYCDFPAEAAQIAKVGDTQSPNAEGILALRPQVVLVSTASQLEAFSETLAAQNIAVFVTDPSDFCEVLQNLQQLGVLFGTEARAAALIEELKRRADAAAGKYSQFPRVSVFVQISKEPLYTIGGSSFLTELLGRVGADVVTRNIEKAFPVLSKETAMALSPDVIILSESADNTEPNDAFKNSPAVASGRVFRVHADILSRPGPRLVDAMEIVGSNLHSDRSTK